MNDAETTNSPHATYEPLNFEKDLLADMKAKHNGLFVFGAGVPTVPKAVAYFLSTYTSLAPKRPTKVADSYPDLIFLINFNEMEFACIEHWLTVYAEQYYTSKDQTTKKTVISLTKISNP